MSEQSRNAPRRTSLAVPGSSDRFLEKAPAVDADAFIFDLEDAVSPDEKPASRGRIARALRATDFGGRPRTVRINGWTTAWARDDVIEVVTGAAGAIDAVMLPKAAGPQQVRELAELLDAVERDASIARGTTGIDVLVETAVGLAHVEDTVAASERVECLSIGAGDLAASLRMPVLVGGAPSATYPGDIYHYALFRLLVAGRAVGITVIDGPYLRVEDLAGLRDIAGLTRALGFDGKWAIHPDQVPVLNEVYLPTPDEVARAEAVVRQLDQAISEDQRGAVRLDDEMIDEASRKMAEAVLARAARGRRGGRL